MPKNCRNFYAVLRLYATTEKPKLEQIGVTDLNLRWREQSFAFAFSEFFPFQPEFKPD